MSETAEECAMHETAERGAIPATDASAKAARLSETDASPGLCRTGHSRRTADARREAAARSPSDLSERSLAPRRPSDPSERSPARTRYRLTKFARAPRFAKPSTTMALPTPAPTASSSPTPASSTSLCRASGARPSTSARDRRRACPSDCPLAASPRPKHFLLARQCTSSPHASRAEAAIRKRRSTLSL